MAKNRPKNSTEQRESRYVQGGTTRRYDSRVGWWERRVIPEADTDITYEIAPGEAQRPDLVAARVYGKATLAWLVLQYNNIVDIQTEFTIGTELRLPTPRRVSLDIMTRATGGKRTDE